MSTPEGDSAAQALKSHEAGRRLDFSLDPLRGFDPAAVVVEPVEPVDSEFGRFGGKCMVLRNLLTPEECVYLIEHMSAPLEKVYYRDDYRRNDRAIYDSPELAELLWARVHPIIERVSIRVAEEPGQQRLEGLDPDEECPDPLRVGYGKEGLWRPKGLNECLRFCRYSPGGFFRAHCDGVFQRSEEERSLFTCMLYLDAPLDGGATHFMKIDTRLTQETYLQPAPADSIVAKVAPEPGLCLLFFQPGILHEGEELRSGMKHILRTDVMFTRDPVSKLQRTPEQLEAYELVQQAAKLEDSTDPENLKAATALYRRAFKLDPKLERML